MARTENDSWDLASSVGATATAVAAARAMASRAEPQLIDDPFAEPLVRAVGVELFTRLASGELDASALGDESPMSIARMADNMAARTRFFDDFFLDACAAGIRQAVILASGLDSRAYRLAWPSEPVRTIVYEIDQPDVIEFKTRVLAEHGAEPTAERRTVAVDLRHDWPAALKSAGFDPSQPTAFSAEGLLAYLPGDDQDRLLDDITALSAPGSRIAVESTPQLANEDEEKARQRMGEAADRMRMHGMDLDLTKLIYFGDRREAAAFLAERGWKINSRTVNELFGEYGLELLDDVDGFGGLAYVSAVLGGEH